MLLVYIYNFISFTFTDSVTIIFIVLSLIYGIIQHYQLYTTLYFIINYTILEHINSSLQEQTVITQILYNIYALTSHAVIPDSTNYNKYVI